MRLYQFSYILALRYFDVNTFYDKYSKKFLKKQKNKFCESYYFRKEGGPVWQPSNQPKTALKSVNSTIISRETFFLLFTADYRTVLWL